MTGFAMKHSTGYFRRISSMQRSAAVRSENSPKTADPLPETGTGQKGRINVTDNSALGLPRAEIRVVCSKGTYIRALARDIGEALDSGAHLDSLRRTRSGDFMIGNAVSITEATGFLSNGQQP